jgi:hypothetical protein
MIKSHPRAPKFYCWVVVSTKPKRTIATWNAARKADAVAAVRDAVRRSGTEGGVTEFGGGEHFEVVFAMVRGKLLRTDH